MTNKNKRTSIPHINRPKGPERAVPASHQILTYQETGTGASRRASSRNHPYLEEHLYPERTGV